MSFKLVRFVEDLVWHVCSDSELKKSNEEIVMAKYGKYFYPALVINEGAKKELLALKDRYVKQDKVLRKYFTFIRNNDGITSANTTNKKRAVRDVEVQATERRVVKDAEIQVTEKRDVKDVEIQVTDKRAVEDVGIQVIEKRAVKATQTDMFVNIIPMNSNGGFCHGNSRRVSPDICSIVSDRTDANAVLNIISAPDSCEENDNSRRVSPDICTIVSDRTDTNAVINIFSAPDSCEENVQHQTVNEKFGTTKTVSKEENYPRKLNFCMFCKTKVSNFARHLESRHRNEAKVSEFLKLPKGDPERLAIIKELRSHGTYMYNTDPLNQDKNIIVARRSFSKNSATNNYVPCPKCTNYFKKSLLYRHYKRCGNVSSAPRNLQALSRATASAGSSTKYIKLRTKILSGMLDDEVSHVAKNDDLILLYGNYLSQKHEGDDHLFYMIRQKLRQLANFLIIMRTIESSVYTLESVFRPNLYNQFIEAARKCAGYNEVQGTYRAPSLLSALGQGLKECAEKLVVECIKRSDSYLRSDVEAWLLVYKKDFPVWSRRANTIIVRRKWNKPRLLPLTSDILKLNNHLKSRWNQAFTILSKNFDMSSWNELAKSTLLLILIFNRKRVGEMEKLLIIDYERKHNIQKDSETYKNLKPSEQIFSQRYFRVEIRGKLGRAVSFMISKQEVAAIDLILKYRTWANVNYDNPYVFGRGENKYFEGARCLREAANNCNAEQPALLRGTKLRKHIATVSQALNLTDNELSILADYMGHNIDIHRHFYRLPNEAIHLAKVSRLLYALDTNKIDKYKGKSLDEINFDADLQCEIESDSDNGDPDEVRSNTIETTMSIPENIEKTCSSKTPESIILHAHKTENMNNSTLSHTTVQKQQNEYSDSEVEEFCSKNKRQKRKIRRLPNISPERSASQPFNDEEQWTPNRIRRKASRICTERRPWKTPEKYAMRLFFKTHLTENRLPTNSECENAISKNSALRQRSFKQVKLWVCNEMKRRSKNACTRQLFD